MASVGVGGVPIPGMPGDELRQAYEPFQNMLQRLMQQKHESRFDPYKQQLMQAQAQREMARAQLPFGGTLPPGPAGQVAGLEMVKKLYGENSPQFKQARDLFELNRQSTEARVNYQNKLMETADKRFSTPLGKSAQELEDVKKGNFPGTDIPLTPEQKKFYEGKYGLDIFRKTTDTDTRKRNLFARNIDVSFSKINPEALTQYSGPRGAIELVNDKRKSLQGDAPEKYKEYEKSLTAAKTLAKQVRQFYGDSITPGVQAGLRELVNPSSWLKSPEIALDNYNSFVDLLKSETQTYQQAGESPDVYMGNVPIENAKSNEMFPPQQENLSGGESDMEKGLMTIIDSNGKQHKIYRDKLDEARKRDPGLRVKKDKYNAT